MAEPEKLGDLLPGMVAKIAEEAKKAGRPVPDWTELLGDEFAQHKKTEEK